MSNRMHFAMRQLMSTAKIIHRKGPRSNQIPILHIERIKDLRTWRNLHYPVALVPTMGALHDGHLALIRAAAEKNNNIVVSVYVNPAQFGIQEDLGSYPVTWDQDVKKLQNLDQEIRSAPAGTYKGRISVVFRPSTEEMYPTGFPGQEIDSKGTFVTVTPVSEVLEGASRPTFFRGVATVCMKLFNIVKPQVAFFGRKDVQQTVVIRKMVREMHVDTNIIVRETVREADGLAMSSRNVYLGTRRRRVAIVLRKALLAAREKFLNGERTRAEILGAAEQVFKEVQQEQDELGPMDSVRFRVDYISLSDTEDMKELDIIPAEAGAILSGAIYMEKLEQHAKGEDIGQADGPVVRLLDNIILGGRVGRLQEEQERSDSGVGRRVDDIENPTREANDVHNADRQGAINVRRVFR